MLSKDYMSIRLFYLEVFAQLFRETNIPGSTASRNRSVYYYNCGYLEYYTERFPIA